VYLPTNSYIHTNQNSIYTACSLWLSGMPSFSRISCTHVHMHSWAECLVPNSQHRQFLDRHLGCRLRYMCQSVCVSFSHYRDLTVGQFLTYFSFVVMLSLILFPANRGQTADPQVWHFLVWGYGMGNSDRSLYFWLCGIGWYCSQCVLPMPETHTN
jgi:hypothetical protein